MISHLSADPAVASGHMPELRVARMAHPTFAQFMAEFLVAQVINHERKFYQVKSKPCVSLLLLTTYIPNCCS